MDYTCYLAGPITGCHFDEAVNWREKFIELLPPEITGLSPMRGKPWLEGTKSIDAMYEANALSSSRGIITRDHFDCRRCDVLVVNLLGAKKVSIGTVMEIAWGKAYGKPIILIMENGNLHDHPMINECVGFRVTSLEQAAEITQVLLLPAPHRKEDG